MKAIKKTVKTVKPATPATPEKKKSGWATFEGFDINIFRVGGMAKPSQPFLKPEGEEKGLADGAILYKGIVRPAKVGKNIILTKDYKKGDGEITHAMSKSLVLALGAKIVLASDMVKPTHLIDTKAGELQGWTLGESGKWSSYALILKSGKILFAQKENGGSKFPNAERVAENSFVKGIVKQLA